MIPMLVGSRSHCLLFGKEPVPETSPSLANQMEFEHYPLRNASVVFQNYFTLMIFGV